VPGLNSSGASSASSMRPAVGVCAARRASIAADSYGSPDVWVRRCRTRMRSRPSPRKAGRIAETGVLTVTSPSSTRRITVAAV